MSVYCQEVQERIEEKIEKPIEEWIERREKKCKKRKCKKWCLCCNKWLCWIETFLEKVIKWLIVTVTKWVVRVVCEIVDGLLSLIAVLVGLIFAIPIIGRLIRQIWSIALDLIWRGIGIFGTIADIIGWEWRKRLRICIVILSNERGPVATEATLKPHIDEAVRIYDQAANVTLIVEGIHTVEEPAPEGALKTACGTGAWWDDLWLPGGWFELTANGECFEGNGRRLIGWASPVVVFVVEDVEGKKGCSLGPFSDYVTVEGGNAFCLAHELGHACGLWHVSGSDNLMNARTSRGSPLSRALAVRPGWSSTVVRSLRRRTSSGPMWPKASRHPTGRVPLS